MERLEEYLEPIQRFEIARRLLDHGGVLPLCQVAEFGRREWSSGNRRSLLIDYADAVVQAAAKCDREACTPSGLAMPSCVMPQVDIANLRVSHTTCTGRTVIARDELYDGELRFWVHRPEEPLDMEYGRDVALSWLGGDEPTPVGANVVKAFALLAQWLDDDAMECVVRTDDPEWRTWSGGVNLEKVWQEIAVRNSDESIPDYNREAYARALEARAG